MFNWNKLFLWLLAMTVVIFVFGFLWIAAFTPTPETNKEYIMAAIGIGAPLLTLVIQFFFRKKDPTASS